MLLMMIQLKKRLERNMVPVKLFLNVKEPISDIKFLNLMIKNKDRGVNMSDTKTNAFKSWTEKHNEFWKFIKFSFAGVSSFIVQYIVDIFFHFVVFKGLAGQTVDNGVFKSLGIDSQMDAAYAYLIAAAVGYTVSFIMNRKVGFVKMYRHLLCKKLPQVFTAWH